MKKLIIYYIARLFHRLKFPPQVALVIQGFLLWLQTIVLDPQFQVMIKEALPDSPSLVASILKWAPSILMALIGGHSTDIIAKGNEVIQERRARKKQNL